MSEAAVIGLSPEIVRDNPFRSVDVIEDPFNDGLTMAAITALNRRVPFGLTNPYDFEPGKGVSIDTAHERLVLGSSLVQGAIDLHFGAQTKQKTDELSCFGTIKGPSVHDAPFVGYIEVPEHLRKDHIASRVLSVINLVCHNVYGQAVTAGPDYYLSDDGRNLQDKMASRYSLQTNHEGFVAGAKR